MSHLSTIISRVKRRLDVYKGSENMASKDSLWQQSVRNLKEYQDCWKDQTPEEVKEANELYAKYSHLHPKCSWHKPNPNFWK